MEIKPRMDMESTYMCLNVATFNVQEFSAYSSIEGTHRPENCTYLLGAPNIETAMRSHGRILKISARSRSGHKKSIDGPPTKEAQETSDSHGNMETEIVIMKIRPIFQTSSLSSAETWTLKNGSGLPKGVFVLAESQVGFSYICGWVSSDATEDITQKEPAGILVFPCVELPSPMSLDVVISQERAELEPG